MTDSSVASCDSGCFFPPAYLRHRSRSHYVSCGERIATVNVDPSRRMAALNKIEEGVVKHSFL